MKKLLLCLFLLSGLVIAQMSVATAESTFPRLLHWQANILDSDLKPINDDNVTITFKIYENQNGGNPVWVEVQDVLAVNGYVNAYLGLREPIDIRFDKEYWLEVTVGSGQPYQRTRLATTPYALYSTMSDTAGFALDIENGIVTQEKLAPGVQALPWGPAGGALTGDYPNPGLDPEAVINSIEDGSITQEKLAPNITLPPGGPAAGDLTGTYPDPLIAVGAVKTDRIFDNAVTEPKIATDAVTPRQLLATGVEAGTYGDMYHVGQFTTDEDGRLTNAMDILIWSADNEETSDIDITGNGEINNMDMQLREDVVTPFELAETTVGAGDYGDATHVGTFTVDEDGRLTGAEDVLIMAYDNGTTSDVSIVDNDIDNQDFQLNPDVVGVPEVNAYDVSGFKPSSSTFDGSMLYYAYDDNDPERMSWTPPGVDEYSLVWDADTKTFYWGVPNVHTEHPIIGRGSVDEPITMYTDGVGENNVLYFDGEIWTNDFVRNGMIGDEAVDTRTILDGTIMTEDIGDNEVTYAKLQDALAADGVILNWNGTDWEEIRMNDNEALSDIDVAFDLIDELDLQIKPETVGTLELQDNAVTLVKMADNSVSSPEIIDNSVESVDIMDGTIVTDDVYDLFEFTSVTADDSTDSHGNPTGPMSLTDADHAIEFYGVGKTQVWINDHTVNIDGADDWGDQDVVSDETLIGNGDEEPLGINLDHENTWNVLQTFDNGIEVNGLDITSADGSVTIDGGADVTGNFYVAGTSEFADYTLFDWDVDIIGGLIVGGESWFIGGATFEDYTEFHGPMDLIGADFNVTGGTVYVEGCEVLTECTEFGGDLSGTYDAIDINDNTIGTGEIINESILAEDIATGAVTTDEILDETILAEDIATGAVTTDEILDETILAEDIAEGAVGHSEINDAVVFAEVMSSGTNASGAFDVTDGNNDFTFISNDSRLDITLSGAHEADFGVNIFTDETLVGDGSDGDELGLNLDNPNTWNALQTFDAGIEVNGSDITSADGTVTVDDGLLVTGGLDLLGVGNFQNMTNFYDWATFYSDVEVHGFFTALDEALFYAPVFFIDYTEFYGPMDLFDSDFNVTNGGIYDDGCLVLTECTEFGGDLSGTYDAIDIVDNTIGTGEIINESILAEDIATGAVTTDEILNETILAEDIATGAVTTDEILNETILAEDIATGAVTTDEILNETILAEDIATGAVTTDEILNETILAEDIATGAVTSDEILDGTIITDDVVDSFEFLIVSGDAGLPTPLVDGDHDLAIIGGSPNVTTTVSDGQVAIDVQVVTDGTSILGNGTAGDPITLNTANSNTWTADIWVEGADIFVDGFEVATLGSNTWSVTQWFLNGGNEPALVAENSSTGIGNATVEIENTAGGTALNIKKGNVIVDGSITAEPSSSLTESALIAIGMGNEALRSNLSSALIMQFGRLVLSYTDVDDGTVTSLNDYGWATVINVFDINNASPIPLPPSIDLEPGQIMYVYNQTGASFTLTNGTDNWVVADGSVQTLMVVDDGVDYDWIAL